MNEGLSIVLGLALIAATGIAYGLTLIQVRGRRKVRVPFTYKATPAALQTQALRSLPDVDVRLLSEDTPSTELPTPPDADKEPASFSDFDRWVKNGGSTDREVQYPPHPDWYRHKPAVIAQRLELIKAGQWPGGKNGGK